MELRSVNHRFFNPTIKLPGALTRWEPEVREALRERISRGHLTLTARVERADSNGAMIDEGAFAERAAALVALQQRHGLGGTVDVATVLRMPDVVRSGDPDAPVEGQVGEIVKIVADAARALQLSREAEGARLAQVIAGRLTAIEASVARIAARSPERVIAHREKLRVAVKDLLDGATLDEQRLAQEIAMLAERIDVGEELDRFASHLAAFRETLKAADDSGVGKRLGFLLQELLREANTTGSKANDAAMQRDVVSVKEELERVREQVENLE